MANKIVLYKLVPFGNGLIAPDDIVEGGLVWENSDNIKDLILCGKIDETLVSDPNNFPEGIQEVITKTKRTQHFNKKAAEALDAKKAYYYKRDTDELYFEAARENQLGNPTKWNKYVARCAKIKALTAIPENDIMEYDDENIPIELLSVFSKLSIRRAMKALGTHDKLKALLAGNEEFGEEWSDADSIDLNDPMVVTALSQATIDVVAVKTKILEMQQ